MYTSVGFRTIMVLCDRHLCRVPDHFHHPQKRYCSQEAVTPPLPLPPAPGNHWSAFCHSGFINFGLSVLDISYKCSHTTCDLLYLTFSLCRMFLRPLHFLGRVSVLHSSLWPSNTLLYRCTTCLFICPPAGRHVGGFRLKLGARVTWTLSSAT